MTRTDESRADEDGTVTVPETVRESADVRPGDTVRWRVGDDGSVSAEIVRETTGSFSGLETLSTGGEPFDSVEAVDEPEEE
ncbi:AbrB/MazE/SpoVT family DNA-binding domain-containing protein [Halobaculum sp. MBLA0143]|uniref:AbrB/MazE/SpoVT family DNA-binding domain-containing protein n=1 Tax=Halobaculum sp. MBLA0143 TaxID=3079933 RepID=UPI003524D558